jgi:hypothetical protein
MMVPPARLVPRPYLGGAGLVARIVLGTNVCRVGVFWDSGESMGEVVKDPHDERVRALWLCGRCTWQGPFKVPTGDHVRFTRGCCALARGALTGTVRRHMLSIRAKPTSLAAGRR